ncbi:MAG TPA: hypothetical protein VGN17_27200 [Bryobacteraceae bacterium]|jgi:nitrogen-specific signal transduction histidine kinase
MSSVSTTESSAALAPSSHEVLRAVAHELRQPLSSIETTAYYLSLVLPGANAKVQEQLSRIQEMIEQANWILSNGLRLTDPKESQAGEERIDIEEIITDAFSARPAGGRPAIRVELAGDLPPVRLDPGRARALVEGLLILFRQIATAAHPATMRTRTRPEGGVVLEIASGVPGFKSEACLGPGSALEISSARRISEAGGGTLECLVDTVSGVCLRASLA